MRWAPWWDSKFGYDTEILAYLTEAAVRDGDTERAADLAKRRARVITEGNRCRRNIPSQKADAKGHARVMRALESGNSKEYLAASNRNNTRQCSRSTYMGLNNGLKKMHN